jgi:lipoprotein-anchoring transpeptidase ErfK/SrfK
VARNDLLNIFLVGTVGIAIAGAAMAEPKKAVTGTEAIAEAAQPQAESKIDGTILHAQVLLDRAGFSPGVIDGLEGMSFHEALRGYQTAMGLEVTGELDAPTRAALLRDQSPATLHLRIDESDAQGPFLGQIPDEPADQAKLEHLSYRNLLEKIAEKFHTTPETIVALNDPQTPLHAGTVLRLPNVLPSSRSYSDVKPDVAQLLSDLNVDGVQREADKVVVDKSDKVVRAYDAEGRLIAQFPATLGSDKDPLPLGTWKVNTIAFNPPFKYQPQLFWDVRDDEEEQLLPPGPNGPVGVVWIDLSREHIGIHGTNSPETIKRAESHGCVRLTNWDAARLTQMIGNGMEVVFQA